MASAFCVALPTLASLRKECAALPRRHRFPVCRTTTYCSYQSGCSSQGFVNDRALSLLNHETSESPILSSRPAPAFPSATVALERAAELKNLISLLCETPTSVDLKEEKCCLYPRENDIFHCRDESVSWFIHSLFLSAASMCGSRLSRYDLHHAHWWAGRGMSGLLFHAREYPAQSEAFPYFLGYCQEGSDLILTSPDEMRNRNVLYVLGDSGMHLLDATLLGGPCAEIFYTVDESMFGERLADLYLMTGPRSLRIVPFI